MAKEIVLSVLDKLGEATKNLFNVKFNPGGESVIKKEFITVFCRELNFKDFIFFDGDQKPSGVHADWRHFATKDLTNNYLKSKIKEQTKEEIKFSVDGGKTGSDQGQLVELQKAYLDYYLNNVFYLPKQIPEDIIWSQDLAESLIEGMVADPILKADLLAQLSSIYNTKEKFVFVSEVVFGDSTSSSVSGLHKQYIKRWLNCENEDYQGIKALIVNILERQ